MSVDLMETRTFERILFVYLIKNDSIEKISFGNKSFVYSRFYIKSDDKLTFNKFEFILYLIK